MVHRKPQHQSGGYYKRLLSFTLSPLAKQLCIGGVVMLFVGLLVAAVWYGTRIESAQINTVVVQGGITISHRHIEDRVWNELQGTYFKIIPKTFTLLYPHEAIVQSLLTQSRIKQVLLTREEQGVLNIEFEEYVPQGLWCSGVTMSGCYFIDREGYAFSEAPQLTGETMIRFYLDERTPRVGITMFETDFLKDIFRTVRTIEEEFSFRVTQVHVVDRYDLNFFLAGGGELKLSKNKTFSESLTDLQTILNDESFAHIAPGNFRYIDLRFNDKVFVNETFEVDDEVSSSLETAAQLVEGDEGFMDTSESESIPSEPEPSVDSDVVVPVTFIEESEVVVTEENEELEEVDVRSINDGVADQVEYE